MKTYEVDIGDKTYEVDAPDEATAWKWANATHGRKLDLQGMQREALSRGGPQLSPAEQVANDPISREASAIANATPAEIIAGNPVTRWAMGAARPVLGAAQFLANGLEKKDESNSYFRDLPNRLQSVIDKGRVAYGSDGHDWATTAGELMSPVMLGAAKIAPASTALGRINQGAIIGGTMGATAPVIGDDYEKQNRGNILAGTLLGGTLNAGIEGVKAVAPVIKHAFEPVYQKGREAILNRYQQGLAGGKSEEMAKLLREAPELVPGSAPKASQALASMPESTGLAAHEQAISGYVGPKGDSSVASAFKVRGADQRNARAALIQQGAGSADDLTTAIANRGANAKQNYGAAAKQLLESDDILGSLMQRPSMDKVIARAADLAKEKNRPFKFGKDVPEQIIPSKILGANGAPAMETVIPKQSAKYPVESLHYMKMAMDDLIANPERFGIGAAEARAIGDTQRQFVGWLGNKSKPYDIARQAFRTESIPVNNMEIMQEMAKRLSDQSGKETPGMFLRSIDDRTPEAASKLIKKTTGFARYDKLSDALTPKNMDAVKAVEADLKRTLQAEQNAAGTNISNPMGLAQKSEGNLPNLLSRPAMVTNWVMKKLGEGADEKIVKMAAERYLNPKMLADALEAGRNPSSAKAKGLAQKIIDSAMGEGTSPQQIKNMAIGEAAYQIGAR